jgi:hypothetical protein
LSAASFPLFFRNTWTASKSTPTANPTLPLSVQRLVSLLDENGEDDYGKIGPSQYAFKSAFRLVANAVVNLGRDLPSSPVVDSEGGIRVTWRSGDKIVKLVCPASKDAPIYIYHSSRSGNSLRNQNVTATVLAERLAWLSDRESAAAA